MEKGLFYFIRSNKVILRTIIITLGILIFGFILFTFYDYETSKVLYGYDTVVGKVFSDFFYVIGYIPAVLVNAFFFLCLFWYTKKIALKVLFGLLAHFHLVFAGIVATNLLGVDSTIHLILGLSIATVLFVPAVLLMKKIPYDTLKSLLYLCVIGVVFATIANGITAGIQYTWGRDRFFYVEDSATLGTYAPWYQLTGDTSAEAKRSFPSMHTSSSFSLVFLMMLAWKFNFRKRTNIILICLSLIIIICVPLSRVVMGYHYMTDILFSLIISIIVTFITIMIVDKIKYRSKANVV